MLLCPASIRSFPPLQFSTRLRTQRPRLHRWIGRIYVFGCLVASLAALRLAFGSRCAPCVPSLSLLSLAWFAGFEGGRWQATPGKRLLGLQVIDDDGLPPGVLRAGLRQAAGLLSWLSLNLGHALAAVPPRHQALHDRIAGIRVVRTDARPLRPAVRLWLALQLPACFLLLALLMRAVDRSLTLALDASWPL